MYRTAVEYLLANSDNVGTRFVEEARKIHYDEVPARTIHGQASDEDFEELQSEGIDVTRLLIFKKREELN